MEPLTLWGFLFFSGALFGSFIFTTAKRLAQGQSLLTPSRCDACGAPISPLGLVPFVGWLVQRGRCRACKTPISWKYPCFELINGLWVCWVFAQNGLNGAGYFTLAITELFWLLALLDFLSLEIALTPLLLALLLRGAELTFFAPEQFIDALIGLFAGAGVLHWVRSLYFFLRHREGLGEGDATLLGLIGFWLGWQALLPVLFLASLLGVLFALTLILFRFATIRQEFAFGPWLILASFVFWSFQPLLQPGRLFY